MRRGIFGLGRVACRRARKKPGPRRTENNQGPLQQTTGVVVERTLQPRKETKFEERKARVMRERNQIGLGRMEGVSKKLENGGGRRPPWKTDRAGRGGRQRRFG